METLIGELLVSVNDEELLELVEMEVR